MKKKQPNVVFLIADDHRFDELSANGKGRPATPYFDGLIENGVWMKRAHMSGGVHEAVCSPSRGSLHTGCNPLRAMRYDDMEQPNSCFAIDTEHPQLTEVFGQAGYHTHGIGKWHNEPDSFAKGFKSGSRIFFGGMDDQYSMPYYDFDPSGKYEQYYTGKPHIEEGKNATEMFCDAAVDFLDQYQEEDPFFMYVGFTSPHDPRNAPQDYHDQYRAEDIELPPNFMSEHPFDNGELDIRDEELAAKPRVEAEIKQHIADYYAMITHLDHQIGRVIEKLKDRGLYEDTIIVYTADHGLGVGQHGLMGKQNQYDHSIRIPMLMSGPGIPASMQSDALVYLFDLYPTLCELCGIGVPEKQDALSFLPLLREDESTVRDSLFCFYKDRQRSVTDGRYKMIRYLRSEREKVGVNYCQLFDLQSDPWEQVNVADKDKYSTVLAELQVLEQKWLKEVPVTKFYENCSQGL